ncbi:MAG: pyridoxamine 5-phosphate oxidase family protein, partial [Marmoricola sp.]|nr:pyridoxamine 5-phosphate oxidase family protein [Marmoricola sp.]
MTDHESWAEIPDVETLTALLGEPTPRVRDKGRSSLTEVDMAWLEASPFCVLATSSAAGDADASPKGDPAGGLVHVIDEKTIALAERPGNRRADGYRNILENPYVGLLFVIPGRGDTLRLNGRARLVSDAPFFDQLVVKGHRPLLAMVVDIDEL